MLDALLSIISAFFNTLKDVLPIVVILLVFQIGVLRQPIPRLQNVLAGFAMVIAGLALFLVGLEQALFPLGELMAMQLTDPKFIAPDQAPGVPLTWQHYGWVYTFAAAIGFSTTLAEPALIAVSLKASEASGGALSSWGLRLAVAVGVSLSIALGTFRIITGAPLAYFMMIGYLVVVVQTLFAPKNIIPLAFDSGGVTTSTVTVPLVTALGLGLASTVPGRSPLLDGFGLIALASLFPMITVMGYAQIAEWQSWRSTRKSQPSPQPKDTTDEIQTHYGPDLGRQDGSRLPDSQETGSNRQHRDHQRERGGSDTSQDVSGADPRGPS